MNTGQPQYKPPTPAQKAPLLAYLNRVEAAATPEPAKALLEMEEAAVWDEVNCLDCANCCKRMTPHFTAVDIKRIATYFRITPRAFKEKWLQQNASGAWTNRLQPCPFLNLQTAKCAIYAIRPQDCAGFPHLQKTPVAAYASMHKQNLSFCPATYRFILRLQQAII